MYVRTQKTYWVGVSNDNEVMLETVTNVVAESQNFPLRYDMGRSARRLQMAQCRLPPYKYSLNTK